LWQKTTGEFRGIMIVLSHSISRFKELKSIAFHKTLISGLALSKLTSEAVFNQLVSVLNAEGSFEISFIW